jgi:type I restriction enzyme S subunit
MIENLKPYPEYKDSGLPWLGEVPAHWSLIPNRGLIRRRKVLVGERHCEYLLLSLTKQGVIVRDLSTSKGKFSSDMGSSQEVRIGDLVFCLFDVPETPRTVGLSTYAGMITGAYTVFEPLDRCCATYFELFYRAMDERKLLSPLYSGLRNTIPVERFLAVKTPQPPPEEQAAIARFLAWATNRLDRAIGAKRRIIALLQEQKQAIIHRAVTRGLDPSVPLKDSGIPWLGEIPEHWEVRRLKDLATVQTGITLGKDYGSTPVSLYPYLRVANVQSDRLDLQNVKHIAVPEAEAKRSTLISGDVLMTEGGDIDKLGRGCLWSGELSGCLHQNHVFAVRCSSGLIPGFLVALMGSAHGRGYFQITAKQTTNLASTNNTTLKAFPLLLPEIQEQQDILSFIDGETQDLSGGITDTEREITLLREYRIRLIADVVTGKLDVREVAAGLSEEELQDQPDVTAIYDGDEAEDDAESDLFNTVED